MDTNRQSDIVFFFFSFLSKKLDFYFNVRESERADLRQTKATLSLATAWVGLQLVSIRLQVCLYLETKLV